MEVCLSTFAMGGRCTSGWTPAGLKELDQVHPVIVMATGGVVAGLAHRTSLYSTLNDITSGSDL